MPVAYGLAASADHRVTVVLPDGAIHRFRMKPRPDVQAVAHHCAGRRHLRADQQHHLQPGRRGAARLCGQQHRGLNSPVDALLLDSGFNLFSPANYRLTLADGTRLDFVRNGALNVLTYRLAKITEPNGAR